ncbi:hypothetical protein VHA01S_080_00150 [Vibrio halioticoli NBRC 102217]|uniref:DNA 3'-5' helicase n=1 Tax=Vibrio halioticoli NBRC 102217 TaxID=1219072 RepID=V5HPU9_9VIBR|nr:DUF87 domain-containing protein [Vibrio halioticoli]GAD91275.1 hypothetical protein VHA01S_080_00150 [Vibrio halioticoli NBRC 102217]
MTTKERTIGKHNLTPEMNDFIEAVISGENVKAYAYAGSGKSTVLRAVEKYHTGKTGLYICYNKSLEQEARKLFSGHNVHIYTSHSFALNSFPVQDKNNFIKKVGVKHSQSTVIKYSELSTNSNLCQLLNESKVCKYILSTIDKYCLTASTEIAPQHLPSTAIKAIDQLVKKKVIQAKERNKLYSELIEVSKVLIRQMFDPRSKCPATHDCYLKVWQLSNPKIAYDYIMFDEAQDANPLLLSVILKQQCQQIFVGDKYQSIYQFRGGINAMDLIPYEGFQLSHSFRFGQKVADLATKVLKHTDPKISIKGVGFDTQVVLGSKYNGAEQFLYISHTNASLLEVLLSCHQAQIPAAFLSNKAEFSLRKLNSMMRLAAGQESVLVAHQKYKSLEHLLLNEKDNETQLFGELIESDYEKARSLHDALQWSMNIPQSKAVVQLSTAHGSKGLEHDVVMLSDDFRATITAFSKGKPLDEAEINLLYVALTRPKKVLIIPDELMDALDNNLAFTIRKTKVDKSLLDNVIPANLPAKPRIKSTPSPKTTTEISPDITGGSQAKKSSTSTEPINKSTTKAPGIPKMNIPSQKTGTDITIEVGVGKDGSNSGKLFWTPTNTAQYMSPNLAVCGTMGTGKTQTVKSIITQMVRQRANNTGGESLGLLIFDYKSDYSDLEFVKKTGALVLPANNLPINPLSLYTFDKRSIINTAKVIISSLSSSFNLGVKQEQLLKTMILKAYERRNFDKDNLNTLKGTPPTLQEVCSAYMSQDKIPSDSLTSAMADIEDFEIFEPNPRKCKPLFELLDNQVVVIELGGLDSSLQSLIVSLLLDQFYVQMQQSPKPTVDGQHRALKKLILVDEADNLMRYKYLSLKKILKEGREFGTGFILSTQGLDHFQTNEVNYRDYMEAWICHRLNGPKPRDIEHLLNIKSKSDLDKTLQQVRELPKHHSLFLDGKKQVHYQESTAFYRL